ncbi:ParB/RepB/Spo0J family partition protein [Rubellicoccus peritrichatus]|uniref:ParB/RepB/Spo0J family partition protein n=1 Tax=Rubellicoccus peritrichatus TaxID=3080537 RepID=A0AAQ3L9U1_9BACT|nr:ParB/RepB/Spo0J family partition protein [Puniceicoccus sp. CR14]WOO39985.1 ParB/RepB/Spo0J family partition protein [Puniceicoccus sp. CR14]
MKRQNRQLFQMQSKDISLDQIDIYGGTQTRVATNDDAISSYAEEMLAGAVFPPIVVYFDGAKYWLADGFHRFLAAQRNGYAAISAEVNEGSRTDALKHALGANATNGIYRSNGDKRNAAEIALEEWPELSNGVIAELCRISTDLVRRTRLDLEKEERIEKREAVTGKDGKQYPSGIEREPRGKTEASSSDSGGGSAGGKPKGEVPNPGGSNAEIEAEARTMIRNGEIKHSELDNLSSATAIDYAETALNVLNRMKENDPKRGDAISRIEKWLEKQKFSAALASV